MRIGKFQMIVFILEAISRLKFHENKKEMYAKHTFFHPTHKGNKRRRKVKGNIHKDFIMFFHYNRRKFLREFHSN